MNIKYLDSEGKELTHFTQWDNNRQIEITGVESHTNIMIHFYNQMSARALVTVPEKQGNKLIAKVPNKLMQQPYNLSVAIYITDNNESKTEYIFVIPVNQRTKPEDYTYEENIDYFNWVELSKQAKQELIKMQNIINETQQKLDSGAFIGEKGDKGDKGDKGEKGDNGDITPEYIQMYQETVSNVEITNSNAQMTQQNVEKTNANVTLTNQDVQKSSQNLQDLLKMLGTDIATLVNGKIPINQIPSIATTEIYTATSKIEQNKIKAENGDICIRTDENKSYIWKDTGWIYLVAPTDYAAKAGYAETAGVAENANQINGHRLVQIDSTEWETAVKDSNTYYLVYDKGAE